MQGVAYAGEPRSTRLTRRDRTVRVPGAATDPRRRRAKTPPACHDVVLRDWPQIGMVWGVYGFGVIRRMVFVLLGVCVIAFALLVVWGNNLMSKKGSGSTGIYVYVVLLPSMAIVALGVLIGTALWRAADQGSFWSGLSDFLPLIIGWLAAVAIIWRGVWRRRDRVADRGSGL